MSAYAHPVASVYANVYVDAHNTCLTYTPAHAWCSQHLSKCMHTLRKKCTCTRACTTMQRCRNFFAMETIANLSWVLRKASCRLLFAARPAAVSARLVARRCSLKKSVQIHASSWRGSRCGVIHTHTHPHLYVHSHTHIVTHTPTHPHTHYLSHAHTHASVCHCLHVCGCSHACVRICACVYVCVCACVQWKKIKSW